MDKHEDLGFGSFVEGILSEDNPGFSMFKHAAPNKIGNLDPKKSRVKTFPSIADALKVSNYGTIFTTPQSDRIYVITKGTWGDKSKEKVVKGFSSKTPFSEIKGYSDRTKAKHGGARAVGKKLELKKKKEAKERKKK